MAKKSINHTHLVNNSIQSVVQLMGMYFKYLGEKYRLETKDVKEKQMLIENIKKGFAKLAKEDSVCLEVPYEQNTSLISAMAGKDFDYVKFFDPVTKNAVIVTSQDNKYILEDIRDSIEKIMTYKNPALADNYYVFNAKDMNNFEKLLFERMMQTEDVMFEEMPGENNKYKIANNDKTYVDNNIIPKLAAVMAVTENKNERIAFDVAESVVKKLSDSDFAGHMYITSPQSVIYADSNVSDISYFSISKDKQGNIKFSSEIKMDTGNIVKLDDIEISADESPEEQENKLASVFQKLCASGDILEYKPDDSIQNININDIADSVISKHLGLYYNTDKEESLQFFHKANRFEKRLSSALVASNMINSSIIRNDNGDVVGFSGPLGNIYRAVSSGQRLDESDLDGIKNERAKSLFKNLFKENNKENADIVRSVFSNYLGKVKLYSEKAPETEIDYQYNEKEIPKENR